MTIFGIITAVGVIAGRIGILDRQTITRLIHLIVHITMPAMIIAAVAHVDPQLGRQRIPTAGCLAVLAFVIMLVFGYIFVCCARVRPSHRAIYVFMSLCTNVSFIGIPVSRALYGFDGVVLASVFVMVLSFFMYSLGFALLARAGMDVTPRGSRASRLFRSLRRAVNMPVLASLAAIGMLYCQISLPPIINDACDMLGTPTAPIAMMCVGAMMSRLSLRELLGELRLYPFIVLRFFVLPLACVILLKLYGLDVAVIHIFAMMCIMPVGSMAGPFVDRFGLDGKLAAKGTIVSTIFAFAGIPMTILAMQYLL
ncbi:AEC family transporter [Trueperella sp. LYQ143]|uniref:AEC family transporter n=1 Tax=unclassified Trueperella TaxID=2630174 RepID=UPI0039833FDB